MKLADRENIMRSGATPHAEIQRKDQSHAISNRVVISANTFWNVANFRENLIKALVGHGHIVTVAAPGPDIDWASRIGVETASISVNRSGLNPFGDARLFGQYLRMFKRSDADFYLGFTVKPNIYGALAARFSRVAALPNVSGLGTAFIAGGALSWLVSQLYRVAFRNCPIVFFQNADDCELFVSRNIVQRDQARLLPGSGVDLKRFAPASAQHSEVRFLLIGRLLGDKGIREYVRAAQWLKSIHPDWRFQLLGPIDEGNRTAIERAELDRWIEDRTIEYLGPADDVRPFISAATAVVLPSYREGMPRTLLEAAAMARPLVATDVPGNRQLVEDGINGLLCRPRDWESLAEAMLSLGQKTAVEREAMGNAARKLVEDFYGEDRVISAYLEAMAQLRPTGGV